MLKHAGERPQQHKQGFVQPVVCSLSLAALLPAVKTAFLGGKGERFDLAAVLYACTLLQKRSSCRDSFRTLLVENNLFGSEAKSWRCNAPAAHYIPALRGEQLLHMIACQCALARLVTLEVDWPLWRDSYSSVSPTYVERDRLNGNPCPCLGATGILHELQENVLWSVMIIKRWQFWENDLSVKP